jgi:hypothetical protein
MLDCGYARSLYASKRGVAKRARVFVVAIRGQLNNALGKRELGL